MRKEVSFPLAWTLTSGNRDDVTRLIPSMGCRRYAAASAGRVDGSTG
jgi:hypothetical protein